MQTQHTTLPHNLTEVSSSLTGTIPACIYDRASEAGGYVYADQAHYNKLVTLAHREGYYVAYYIWEDGKGDKESRKGYQQVLELAKEGKIKVVLIADPARFSRGGHERIQKFELLEKQGCQILRGDKETYDRPGALRYQEAYEDREYLNKQALKAVDSLPYAINNKRMPGATPTGLKRELRLSEDKTTVEHVIVHHPVYGPLVQQMAQDYINGKPVRQIVDELNASDVPNPHAKETGKWSYTTVYSIFHTWANIGVIKWGRRHTARHIPYSGPILTVEGDFEPLFDEATWAQLHARLDVQNTGKTMNQRGFPAQLLSGTLKCRECGSKVYITSSMKKGKNYYKYVCAQTHRYLSKCENASVAARLADEAVINQLLRLTRQQWSVEGFDTAVQTDPHEPLRIKLAADLAQEQENMKVHTRKVLSLGDMPQEMHSAMKEIADEIALRIRHLQDQLASVPTKTYNPVQAKELYDRMAQRDIASYIRGAQELGDTEGLREIVGTLVKEATISRRGSATGKGTRATWAMAEVTWSDDVELLLKAGVLALSDDQDVLPAPSATELGRDRQRRRRARKAAEHKGE